MVRIGNSVVREGFGSLDDGAGIEMQVHVAGQSEGQRLVGAGGDDEMPAAGFGDCGDGVFEGVGVEGLAVADGAEIGEIEFGVGITGGRR